MRTDFTPGSSRPIAFQFPTESKPWAQRHVASIERRAFIFLHFSDPSRAIIATPLPHTARTAAQPYIARTVIRSSHTPRTRIIVVIVVVVIVVVAVVVVVVVVVLTFTRIIKSVVTGQAPVLG